LLKRAIKIAEEVPKPYTSTSGKVRIKFKLQEHVQVHKNPIEVDRKPPVFKQSAQSLAAHFKQKHEQEFEPRRPSYQLNSQLGKTRVVATAIPKS
jgi:hypothetical protein